MPISPELRKAGFFRLWTGETLSLAGSQITYFATPLIAVLVLDAGSWEMGLLAAAGSAATLLFGLSAGVWADSFERRRLLQFANLVRGLALAVIPVLWLLDALTIWVLLAVTFTVGALSLLFDSAMSAYLPRLVGKKQLGPANAWMEGSSAVGEVAGPGAAGVLVQFLGAPLAIAVDAASYAASALALRGLPRAEPSAPDGPREKHLRAALTGLKLLMRDPVQRSLALAAAHFNFFSAMFYTLYTLYVVKTLGLSPALLGVLSAAGGVGALLGSATAARISERFGYGVPLALAYAAPGAAGLLVPLAEGQGKAAALVLVGFSQFGWVLAVVVNLILSETIKQALVPDHMLGRITGSVRFISWGVEPFGALLAGALGAGLLGLRTTLVLSGLGVLASALWPLVGPARKLRTLPGSDQDSDIDGTDAPDGTDPVTGARAQ
ncbi:MFS transporter [Streptomyces sp. KM273126]|uniref:MFS transporter n=1 Tax=Streptomyces sp. KM273126 TaxID=2545247 RepID=UPI00103C2AA7|nr:MFS transporter [Streptomyces sp. KM273126]MBA2808637.1 MFS transporter [Streptomyces sp. KM273126]